MYVSIISIAGIFFMSLPQTHTIQRLLYPTNKLDFAPVQVSGIIPIDIVLS